MRQRARYRKLTASHIVTRIPNKREGGKRSTLKNNPKDFYIYTKLRLKR